VGATVDTCFAAAVIIMDDAPKAPFIKGMVHVLSFPDPHPSTDTEEEMARTDAVVGRHVWAIASRCKRLGTKFVDPDFGPRGEGDHGASSLYGTPPTPPGGSSSVCYPRPEQVTWLRPLYADKDAVDTGLGRDDDDDDDDNEGSGGLSRRGGDGYNDDEGGDDEEGDDGAGFGVGGGERSWCPRGCLFKGGSSSGDVVQGALGDCWCEATPACASPPPCPSGPGSAPAHPCVSPSACGVCA